MAVHPLGPLTGWDRGVGLSRLRGLGYLVNWFCWGFCKEKKVRKIAIVSRLSVEQLAQQTVFTLDNGKIILSLNFTLKLRILSL